MFELIGGIFEIVFSMVGMVLELVFGMISFVFGLLGGIASLIFSLAGVVLLALLVTLFIRRRGKKQEPRRHIYVDEDGEEFTSYYHQQEE